MKLTKATDFQIGRVERVAPANEWDGHADALIGAAVDADGNIDREVSITINVPAGETKQGLNGEGASDRVKFQRAIRAKGYTANYFGGQAADEANTRFDLTFTLAPAQKSRTSKDSTSADESATLDIEAPTE